VLSIGLNATNFEREGVKLAVGGECAHVAEPRSHG
jgi:hypothetical protein